MNGIPRYLRLLTIYYSVSLIRSNPQEQPLIFNPETLQIYPDWISTTETDGPFAVACPAEQDTEIQFNRENSLDHGSLFMRDYSLIKTDSIQIHLCDEYFKMTAVQHTDENTNETFVEFGHEVYIDRAKFTQYFKKSDFNNFRPLLPLSSNFDERSVNSATNFNADNALSSAIDDSNIDDGTMGREMDFVWLPRVVMKYNFFTWNLENLTYYITQHAPDMRIYCDNDNLGSQLYGQYGLEKYYSHKNQKIIFSQVILPEDAFEEGSICEMDKYCITAYNLLWPYQYQVNLSVPILCSDVPTIPVWHETAENLLDYSEKFLVAVAEVVKQRLKIIVGTHKTLTFPTKYGKQPREMYLQNGKMPIPKIIYKIVKYKSHECDVEKELCWFNVVIVIHNQPEVNPEDIICEDQSENWGWESIQFMSTERRDAEEKWEFIYTCKLDETIEEKLGYKSEIPIRGDFNLNNFPYYNEHKGKIEFQNWRKKFEMEMYYLYE